MPVVPITPDLEQFVLSAKDLGFTNRQIGEKLGMRKAVIQRVYGEGLRKAHRKSRMEGARLFMHKMVEEGLNPIKQPPLW
jgi:hypothetical protein